jgi:hypothetical protein
MSVEVLVCLRADTQHRRRQCVPVSALGNCVNACDSSGEDSPRPGNASGRFCDGEGLEHRVEVPHDVVHGVRAGSIGDMSVCIDAACQCGTDANVRDASLLRSQACTAHSCGISAQHTFAEARLLYSLIWSAVAGMQVHNFIYGHFR